MVTDRPGVTDRHTVSLYLKTMSGSFRNPATGADNLKFNFTGVSLENRYPILNLRRNPAA